MTVNATETDKDVVVGSSCAVEFVTCNDWGSGQVPAITLRNTGTAPINGWSLSWTESNDVALSNSWNTTLAQSGRSFVATPVSYNQTVLGQRQRQLRHAVQLQRRQAAAAEAGLGWP